MKTIEEAVKEHINNLFYCSSSTQYLCKGDLTISFIEGVDFAQSWISVTEEKPSKGVEIILKNSNKKIVFTPKSEDDIKWCIEKFTHWRLIELK